MKKGRLRAWERNRKGRKRRPVKTIALVGTRPGAGATHTAILLAEYLKEQMGARTAVFEMNRHGHMGLLEKEAIGFSDGFFSLHGVDYYKEAGEEMEHHLLEDVYNYLILDFGAEKKRNGKAIEACDEKVIIGSLGLWEQQEYLFAVQNFEKYINGADMRCAVNFGGKKQISRMEKKLRKKIYFLGYQPFGQPASREAEYFFSTLA